MQRFDTINHGGTLITVADSMRLALEEDPARNFGAQVLDRPS